MTTELATLDKAFETVIRYFKERGDAPHYTELAKELGVSVEEGRQALRDLIATGIPAWLAPGDYIVSFAPFNNLPTQYRLTIEGEQKWFAQ